MCYFLIKETLQSRLPCTQSKQMNTPSYLLNELLTGRARMFCSGPPEMVLINYTLLYSCAYIVVWGF